MFTRPLILAIVAGIFSTIVFTIYATVQSQLFNFSELANMKTIGAYSLCVALFASLIYIVLNKLANNNVANFITGILLSGVTIACVFYLVKRDDFQFQGKAGQEMADYFKGFLMPVLFFPALSWFTFKSLIIPSAK